MRAPFSRIVGVCAGGEGCVCGVLCERGKRDEKEDDLFLWLDMVVLLDHFYLA